MLIACFGDKESMSLYDAILECMMRILKSIGWNSDTGAATAYETLYTLSNTHLMNALNCCSLLVAWMCETMDGAIFVASDVRSISILTRICLTGCCMVDPQRAHFLDAAVAALQALEFVSAEARAHALHAAVGALVALSRLMTSEMLLSKSMTDSSLLLASWRLSQSSITFQRPTSTSRAGPDKMNRNFLDIMYVIKFSQVCGKLAMAKTFDIEDSDTQIRSSVHAAPAALRQVALSAYFENILAIKEVRAEYLQLAENRDFAHELGDSCASELRGLLCGLGWGVFSSLRITGKALSRLRELFTPYLVAAGYHHTAFVHLQNVERYVVNPQHDMVGDFVEVLSQWRRCSHVIDSYRRSEQAHDPVASARSANDNGVSLSLQCLVSIVSPILAGDDDCNFKTPVKFAKLSNSIQTLLRYIRCSALLRTRHRLVAAANKIKYSAKRAIFNRYVGSKLLAIVRASQPQSIWPTASNACISWGHTAADIAESAVKDWQASRHHVKHMSTTTERFYQGRTRLSMQNVDKSSHRKMMYSLPDKTSRGPGKSWNISSSEDETEDGDGDSDDSCDSLAEIEKEEMLDGTKFVSSRMYAVSELPINAFTSKFCARSATSDNFLADPGETAAEALDLSHAYYIENYLQSHSWGSKCLCLKSQYNQRQVRHQNLKPFIQNHFSLRLPLCSCAVVSLKCRCLSCASRMMSLRPKTAVAPTSVASLSQEKRIFCEMNLRRQSSHSDGLIYLRNRASVTSSSCASFRAVINTTCLFSDP
jgi:hypothetical protein